MQNKKYWEFKNLAEGIPSEEQEEIELSINGEIVNIACWEGDVSSKTFKNELDKYPNAKKIIVGLNTPGGDIYEAVQIGNYLKSHPAQTVAKIYAMCASAGATIASSCDEVQMYDNAIYMIHDPMTVKAGGIEDFKKVVEKLEIIKQSVITGYKNHCPLSEEEISNLMTEETWMTAEQALENGFITEIIGSKAEPEKVEEVQNFMHEQVWNNFKKFPKGMFKNLIQSLKTEPIRVQNKIENKGAETMDLKELKEKHPEVYNQVMKEHQESIQNTERERIKNIMNLGAKVKGADEIIKNAIDTGKTAEQTAFEIMNNASVQTIAQAQTQVQNLVDDTNNSGVPKVEGENPDDSGVDPQEKSVINSAIESFKNTK